jgi:colicin import membrane protein
VSDVDRSEILAYAEQHGATAAGEHFKVSPATIRSWRHRAAQTESDPEPPASGVRSVAPGDDGWQCAKVEARPGHGEASKAGGGQIAEALSAVNKEGVSRAAQYGHAPPAVLRAWQARDRGDEPPMAPGEALIRLQYAFSSLPDDVRMELAAVAEEKHWAYHALDVEHHRILAERKRQAETEEMQRQRAERERAAAAEAAERAEREAAEEAERAAAVERAERAGVERERAATEAEALRRASEAARRQAA